MDIKYRKFQEGGAVPVAQSELVAEEPATTAELNPLMMIALAAAQALQSLDCNAAMLVCEAFLQIVEQALGGMPQEAPQGEPVYGKGGVLLRRI